MSGLFPGAGDAHVHRFEKIKTAGGKVIGTQCTTCHFVVGMELCEYCAAPYDVRSRGQKFCQPKCRKKDFAERLKRRVAKARAIYEQLETETE